MNYLTFFSPEMWCWNKPSSRNLYCFLNLAYHKKKDTYFSICYTFDKSIIPVYYLIFPNIFNLIP